MRSGELARCDGCRGRGRLTPDGKPSRDRRRKACPSCRGWGRVVVERKPERVLPRMRVGEVLGWRAPLRTVDAVRGAVAMLVCGHVVPTPSKARVRCERCRVMANLERHPDGSAWVLGWGDVGAVAAGGFVRAAPARTEMARLEKTGEGFSLLAMMGAGLC